MLDKELESAAWQEINAELDAYQAMLEQSLDVVVTDLNPNHEPAGSPKGGQFASKEAFASKFGIKKVPLGRTPLKISPGLARDIINVTGYSAPELTGIIGRDVPLNVVLTDVQNTPSGLEFSWSLRDKNTGERVGEIGRIWSEDGLEVSHENFVLSDKVSGAGIGKTILGNMMAIYQEQGVQRIHVDAGLDRGGYAWAKFGFRPTEKSWNNDIKEWFIGAEDLFPADLKSKLNLNDSRAIWTVADHPGGKEILSGSQWDGYLDLKDEEAMNRFYTYVNKAPTGSHRKDAVEDNMLDETDIMLAIIEEADGVKDKNPYHEPAGTSKGGQFASKPGGAGGTFTELEEDQALVQKFLDAEKAAAAIPPTDQIDTPERNAMRARIADELYNTNIENRVRGREATILLGLPGVGKSTFANPLLEGGALEIDPDLAKAKIPEFAGGVGANAVHEESSIINRTVLGRAVANGDNFVWPRIDNPGRIKDDIVNLKAAGYKVHVKFLDADPRVAIKSVINRFEKTGRYVSPLTVKGYGDTPRDSAKIAQLVGVDSYEEYYRGEGEQFRRVK